MLWMPSDPNSQVSVVGIDPGTEHLGVGVITFDFLSFEIVESEAYTFTGSRLPSSDWMAELHGDRTRRLDAHTNNLLRVFQRVEPLCVACEAPFINMKRPQAYGALTEAVTAIRRAVLLFDNWRPLYMVEPSKVKNAVGASGGADKDAVKAAMLKLPALTTTCTSPIEFLDEHSVDALAVAYHQYLACKGNDLTHLV